MARKTKKAKKLTTVAASGLRWRRNLFTGKLEQVPSDGGGRHIIYREEVYYQPKRQADPWGRGKDAISRPLSIKPEEATPEKIAALNENAKRNGTGAYYTPDGACHTPTRGSRAREMPARRNFDGMGYQDNDAGYSDYAGR